MKELDGIKTIIEERLIKKEIIGKTTQKGFEFEDTLEDFLLRVSKPFGDAVGRVGTEKGKLGNLKGDFVVTLNDIGIKGQPPKIVIEAKAGEHVRLTQKGLLGELDEAMKNREAQFAIAVTESIISEAIGNYREIERDKLICAFGDNGLPLEVAYKVARTGLLLNMYKEKGREIDMTRLRGVINKIDNDLKAVQGIRAKLTSIENTSDAINDDVKSLEVNIRNSLTELQDIIRGGTSTSVD
jgi:flagellin-like hook-associated protein FlgL